MRLPSALRSTRLAVALAVASGTAGVAVLTSVGSSAQADPSFTSAYAGVGADVTQDLYAAFTGASPAPGATTSQATTFYSPVASSTASGSKTIDSFDASPAGGTTVVPGCITTKLGGPSFDRPNSSSAGITALTDAVNGTAWQNTTNSCTGAGVNVTGEIDFARSARDHKSTGSTLTFIPFARDAVGVLFFDHGDGALNSLTTAQLAALYSSSTGTATIGGDTVKACLTLTGSTPRTNLENAISVSDSTANIAATAAGCNNIQQNSGDSFYSAISSLPAGTDAVIPISSASWESQFNQVGVDRSSTARTNGVDLAAITNGASVLGQPYTVSGGKEVPNTTYYQDTSYGYNIFTVVPTNKITGVFADAGLQTLFVGSSSALCAASAQSTAHLFGFDSLTGSSEPTCGATTDTGNS